MFPARKSCVIRVRENVAPNPDRKRPSIRLAGGNVPLAKPGHGHDSCHGHNRSLNRRDSAESSCELPASELEAHANCNFGLILFAIGDRQFVAVCQLHAIRSKVDLGLLVEVIES